MKYQLEKTVKMLEDMDRDSIRGFTGFDGFVDEVVHVVDHRFDREHYSRIKTIHDYSKRIERAAGLSTNIEVVSIRKKLGGNGPIFANALQKQGIRSTYTGTLGYPVIEDVFQEFSKENEVISVGNPGYTDAVEFLDGKIIRSKLDSLNQIDWETVKMRAGLKKLQESICQSDFVAFLNWSLMMNMNGIWRGILEEILTEVPKKSNTCNKKMFVDLADPEKRSEKDIKEALACIGEFNTYFEVILGLNKKEACELAEIYGKKIGDYQKADIKELCQYLKRYIPADIVVIHSVKEACAKGKTDMYYQVNGPYCQEPKLTTGAGDHFNAGFMLAQLAGASIEQSLYTAVYLSGYYVRNAGSPDRKELIEFIKTYCSKNE